MTCPCCSERHKPVYMDGCDQCRARWISRLPAKTRDEQLQRLPRLREQARAAWDRERQTAALYALSICAMTSATAVGLLRLFDRFRWLAGEQAVSSGVRLIGCAICFWLHAPIGGFLLAWALGSLASFLYLGGLAWREMRRRDLLAGFTLAGPLGAARTMGLDQMGRGRAWKDVRMDVNAPASLWPAGLALRGNIRPACTRCLPSKLKGGGFNGKPVSVSAADMRFRRCPRNGQRGACC